MSNIGIGGYQEIVTDSAGTGEWEWYIAKAVCGASGEFSTLGFVAIEDSEGAGKNNIVWQVSYFDVIEATADSEPSVLEIKTQQ